MILQLEELGWDGDREEEFGTFAEQGFSPGRIASQHRTGYGLLSEEGACFAEVTGRLLHTGNLPVVGDWVATLPGTEGERGVIIDILDRRTRFSRQAAGDHVEEQVIAANLEIVFIVTDLGRDYNPRRLERYLTLIKAGGAKPAILLNKSDLAEDVDGLLKETTGLFTGIDVLTLSALQGTGLEEIRAMIPAGSTGALVGSSGVGKSTLINRLIGDDRIETREIRISDGKGRHTTSRRELFPIPGGGLLIDTPGMREVQLWGDEESLSGAFPEIEELAASCRFRDCRHESEPGCAVLEAVEVGTIPAERLEGYRKQQKEIDWHLKRSDPVAREEADKRIARLVKEAKRMKKR